MSAVSAEKEVFSVPGWNFIGGDRHIEAILRDLPAHAPLVVRNRLANVLATVAGLVDLAGCDPREPLTLSVKVPENALIEPVLPLGDVYLPELFYELLLTRLYQVPLALPHDAVPDGSLLLATGYTEAQAGPALALADWLKGHPDLPLILLAPLGVPLAACLRPYAQNAWSTQHWGGLDAFHLATVEEAVNEQNPQRIYVAGASPAAMMYTAVGAVDYMLRGLAAEHGAKGARPYDASQRVRALGFASQGVPAGPPATLLALVKQHLEETLGVASTAFDGQFRATGEAIAIDLV
jgi:hypothetical protein